MQKENKANLETGEKLNQKIQRKRYVFDFINKRTYGLVALTIIVAIGLVIVLVQQRKLLVLKKTWNTVATAETVTTEVFNGYKTVLSIRTFEMLADKFARRKGTFSLESNPMKHRLRVTYDSSVIAKKDILRVLYTKASFPVAYPTCTQNEIFSLRLWISNYYDAFDGLLLRSMLTKIKGVYLIESGFEDRPYVDLVVNTRVDFLAIIEAVEAKKSLLIIKDNQKEFDVNYKVDRYSVNAVCKPIEVIRRKVLPMIDYKSDENAIGSTDSMVLVVDKIEVLRGVRFSQLMNDSNLKTFKIQSFVSIPDSLPLVKIRFITQPKFGRNELLRELNKVTLTHKTKYGVRKVGNSFHFKPLV